MYKNFKKRFPFERAFCCSCVTEKGLWVALKLWNLWCKWSGALLNMTIKLFSWELFLIHVE